MIVYLKTQSNSGFTQGLKLYKKVLIMISGGLQFGEGNSIERIEIWLNVTIKLQKAMISLNKHEL